MQIYNLDQIHEQRIQWKFLALLFRQYVERTLNPLIPVCILINIENAAPYETPSSLWQLWELADTFMNRKNQPLSEYLEIPVGNEKSIFATVRQSLHAATSTGPAGGSRTRFAE